MLKIELDKEQLQRVIDSAVNKVAEKHSTITNHPKVMSRSQVMDFLGVRANKVSELFKRKDFPVIRELGHPKVLTHLLIQWLEEHSDWVKENDSEYLGKRDKL